MVVAAMAFTALAGCGSPAKSEAGAGVKVATLTSPAAGASASASAAAGPQRPRERLDMTSEEQDALMVGYEKCLKTHGLSVLDAKKSQDAAKTGGVPDKWTRYCEEHYFPLPPWEQDPANPEARDFAVAVVKCLKGKGVEEAAVTDDGVSITFGGDGDDSRSISLGLELEPQCEREVAAQKK
jgi:hypothetical protein